MMPVISTMPLPGGGACLRLVGEFDLAAAPSLRRQLLAAVASAPEVVVAADSVTFLDCACLAALNAARLRAAEGGSRFCLVGAGPSVVRLLELTNLAEHIECHPDLASALDGPIRSGSCGSPSRSPS